MVWWTAEERSQASWQQASKVQVSKQLRRRVFRSMKSSRDQGN